MALKAISGGVDGFLNGEQQNAKRDGIMQAYSHLPDVPHLRDSYMDGFWKQVQSTPGLLQLDQTLRQQYLPQELSTASGLYQQYLPKFAKANLRALTKVDPEFVQGRQQLYSTVSGDLSHGSELDPALQDQLTGYIRGGQAARGNLLGNAPVAAEALYLGQNGQALKQQRIANMQSFLRGPTPESQFGSLAGGGAGALSNALSAATHPGYSFLEGPHDWAGAYLKADQQEFTDADTQALARAKAEAAAPAEVNPWLTSFAGGLEGLSSSFGGGGKSGGGGGGGFGSFM